MKDDVKWSNRIPKIRKVVKREDYRETGNEEFSGVIKYIYEGPSKSSWPSGVKKEVYFDV